MSGAKRAPSSSVKKATASGRARWVPVSMHALDHLEPGEDAVGAVVAAARADGVDVRATHDGGEIAPPRAGVAGLNGDHVADAVDADVEAQIPHPRRHQIAAGLVLVGQRQPGAPGRAGDGTHLGQLVEPPKQAGPVDAEGLVQGRGHRVTVPSRLYEM